MASIFVRRKRELLDAIVRGDLTFVRDNYTLGDFEDEILEQYAREAIFNDRVDILREIDLNKLDGRLLYFAATHGDVTFRYLVTKFADSLSDIEGELKSYIMSNLVRRDRMDLLELLPEQFSRRPKTYTANTGDADLLRGIIATGTIPVPYPEISELGLASAWWKVYTRTDYTPPALQMPFAWGEEVREMLDDWYVWVTSLPKPTATPFRSSNSLPVAAGEEITTGKTLPADRQNVPLAYAPGLSKVLLPDQKAVVSIEQEQLVVQRYPNWLHDFAFSLYDAINRNDESLVVALVNLANERNLKPVFTGDELFQLTESIAYVDSEVIEDTMSQYYNEAQLSGESKDFDFYDLRSKIATLLIITNPNLFLSYLRLLQLNKVDDQEDLAIVLGAAVRLGDAKIYEALIGVISQITIETLSNVIRRGSKIVFNNHDPSDFVQLRINLAKSSGKGAEQILGSAYNAQIPPVIWQCWEVFGRKTPLPVFRAYHHSFELKERWYEKYRRTR